MPSSCGRCGSDAAVGDDRAGLVGLLERPLDPAVEDRLVPRRQLLAGDVLDGRLAHRSPSIEVRRPTGSLWAHHTAIDGMVAEQVDRLAGLAHGLLADRAGVAPLQREVLPHQHAELVGGVVQLGAGDVAVHAQQVEAGLAGQLDVAAHLGRRRVGRAPCASAPGWRP